MGAKKSINETPNVHVPRQEGSTRFSAGTCTIADLWTEETTDSKLAPSPEICIPTNYCRVYLLCWWFLHPGMLIPV